MTTIFLALIGKNIRKIRKEKKISQEELSFRANLYLSYIGKLERGEVNVSIETLEKIASALETDIDKILERPITWKNK